MPLWGQIPKLLSMFWVLLGFDCPSVLFDCPLPYSIADCDSVNSDFVKNSHTQTSVFHRGFQATTITVLITIEHQ